MNKGDDWFETSSGCQCWVNGTGGPRIYTAQDIVLGCARKCRYGGQIRPDVEWYSVAEHQVLLVRHAAPAGYDLRELRTLAMHDAAEGLLPAGDIVRPIKRYQPESSALEDEFMAHISVRFDLIWPLPEWLKNLDLRIMFDERDQIMPRSGNEWALDKMVGEGNKHLHIRTECWSPRRAAEEYMRLLKALGVRDFDAGAGSCV
jgi:hypothetical protein